MVLMLRTASEPDVMLGRNEVDPAELKGDEPDVLVAADSVECCFAERVVVAWEPSVLVPDALPDHNVWLLQTKN